METKTSCLCRVIIISIVGLIIGVIILINTYPLPIALSESLHLDKLFPLLPSRNPHYVCNSTRAITYMSRDSNRCPPDLIYLPDDTSDHVTALASFPGSGNTWTRHLLQYAAGVYTGDVENNTRLYERSNGEFAPFAGSDTSFIAIKTHFSGREHMERFSRAILVVRNPYNAIFAEIQRWIGRKNGTMPKMYKATAHELNREVTVFKMIQEAFAWHKFHTDWLTNFDRPILIVNYSDLMEDTPAQMCRMLDFLGWKINEQQMECVIDNSEGDFHRPGRTEEFKFNEKNEQILKKSFADVLDMFWERFRDNEYAMQMMVSLFRSEKSTKTSLISV